jgi:hypothetical protein
MKYRFLTLIITAMAISNITAQNLDSSKIRTYEHQLDDVMEIIDTIQLKIKLKEVEQAFQKEPTEINKVRLGIIYHEITLNFSFFSKTEFKGYAGKSFDLLNELANSASTTKELMPFITAYRASALSLVGAETKKLKFLSDAFKLFEDAVNKYSHVSYLPEFLRGSVAENLPWFFFSKRKRAKQDFKSIIDKQTRNNNFANDKVMSFVFYAWANQHQEKKYRVQAIAYLDKTILLDPNYKAGRKRAEELKIKLTK